MPAASKTMASAAHNVSSGSANACSVPRAFRYSSAGTAPLLWWQGAQAADVE